MVKYGYIPIGQTISFENDSNVNATPLTWTIEAYGTTYGGVEVVDMTISQENEVISKGGQMFDKEGYLAWYEAGAGQTSTTVEI